MSVTRRASSGEGLWPFGFKEEAADRGEDNVRCPACKSEDFTRIEIQMKDGESLVFFACRNCEEKWWEDDAGANIDLTDVLALASEQAKPARRDRAH